MTNSMVWIEMLGWMLIHSVWLIAVIVGMASITIACLRRRSASARYLVGCLAMVLSATTLPASLIWSKAHQGNTPGPILSVGLSDNLKSQESHGKPADEEATQVPESSVGGQSLLADAGERRPDITDDWSPILAETTGSATAATPESTNVRRIEGLLRPYLWILVNGWFIGMLILSLRPLIGWQVARRLRKVGLEKVARSVSQTLQELLECLGVTKSVDIFQSSLVQIPCVVGAWKPVILLPAAAVTGLSFEQLEAVLAHELAHIRRHDYLINILQTVVETLLFYHPAIWWISRQIRIEREHCCDDLVVASLANRTDYCRALLAVEELRGRNRTPLLVLGSTDGSLLSRVRRIAGIDSEHGVARLSDRWSVSLLGFVLICGTYALLTTSSLAAKEDAFRVQFPDGIEIELLGCSTGEKFAPWWAPDGTPLEHPPLRNSEHSTHSMYADVASECRSVAVRFRGKLPRQAVRRIIVENVPQVVGSGSVGEHLIEEIVTSEPISNIETTTVRIGFGQGALQPPQALNMAATKLPATLPPELKPWYDAVLPTQIEEKEGKTRLHVKPLDSAFGHEIEWTAMNQLLNPTVQVTGQYIEPGLVVFDIHPAQIAHIEYRLRPYRHWVTFENVSLKRGLKTHVQATRGLLPPNPDRYIAHVANGIRVEFVGLSTMEGDTNTWWKPDGRKLEVVPEHESGLMTIGDSRTGQASQLCRTLIHVYGARGALNTTWNLTGTRQDKIGNSEEPYVSCVGALEILPGTKVRPVEVGIAMEPLSAIRTINPMGRRIPTNSNTPADRIADQLEIESVRHPKLWTSMKNGVAVPETAEQIVENNRRRARTEVTWTIPKDWKQIDLEMTLIDVDRKSHRPASHSSFADSDELPLRQIKRGSVIFDVPSSRVSHFEYRYRVYRHWAKFENVSVSPGKSAQVKTSVSTIERPEERTALIALPASEDEKAIAKLEVIFFQKLSSRILPVVAVTTGKTTYAITTSPSTIVPDGTVHAIDGNALEFDGNPAIEMESDQHSTKVFYICRTPGKLTQFQLKDPVKLVVGDVLSALYERGADENWRVHANAASVTALNRLADLRLVSHGVHHKYSQLVQLDRCFPEGTILFKDGKLAGITLLGTRFLGADSRKSYAVSAERIAELVALLQRDDESLTPDTSTTTAPANDAKKTSPIKEPADPESSR